MKNKSCQRCRAAPTKTKHANCKYCEACRIKLLSRPRGGLSREQKDLANSLRGKMSRENIAEELGVSLSALKRSFRGHEPFWFSNGKLLRNPTLTKEVSDFYSEHGMPATIERFPGVKVKSIVYRYHEVTPRLIRWNAKQLADLVRMAGIVPFEDQAQLFDRPGAGAGSIKSAWSKKFKTAPGEIHGMKRNHAKHLVSGSVPYLKTQAGQYICLWVDMEKHLDRSAPEFVRDAVRTLADFQRWLFGRNPKAKILSLRRLECIR